MAHAFRFTNVTKTYPDFRLGPLNLELEPGTVLGYVGPNGAGKTTTLHCLVGLIKADDGDIEIFGRRNDPDYPDWKLDIGYVGDEYSFFESWSGTKNLRFLSQFYPGWSESLASELAKRFELPLSKKAKDLSKGNRVKLALVAALAHSPKLLLFDEPTSGLDPVVRAEVLDVLFAAVESGERAIFYSTHILSDISRLADDLAFIRGGQVIQRTAKDDLTDRWRRVSFRHDGDSGPIDGAVVQEREGDEYRLISSNHGVTMRHLRELGVQDVHETRLGIDEITVQILKGGGHVADS